MVIIKDMYGREITVVGSRGTTKSVELKISKDNSFLAANLNITETEALITVLKETIKFCKE